MYLKAWEDFEKAAEKLYLSDPNKAFQTLNALRNALKPVEGRFRLSQKCRFVTSYSHKGGFFKVKMTDDATCLQYKTDVAQDLKKMEKFVNNLMRHMAAKEH